MQTFVGSIMEASNPPTRAKLTALLAYPSDPSLVRIDALPWAASIRVSGEYAPSGGAVQLLTTARALRPAQMYQGHSRATFEALIGHPLRSYRAFAEEAAANW